MTTCNNLSEGFNNLSFYVILYLRACAGVYYYIILHEKKKNIFIITEKNTIMDYDKIIDMKRDDLEAELEIQRQTKGLVKLLWTGIAVAGILIALGMVLLLTA